MKSIDDFFVAFQQVINFYYAQTNRFLNQFYTNPKWNYLFYCAMLPAVLAIVFDIVMTFILSVRLREIRFFNCFSPRSWRLYSDTKNRVKSSDLRLKASAGSLRYTRLNRVLLMKFKKYRRGDVVRADDGFKATYLGMRSIDDNYYYAYKTSNGIYYSRLSPKQFVHSSGSQRIDNTVKSVTKSNEKGG